MANSGSNGVATDLYREVRCRACGGDLDSILHLGDLVLPDYLPDPAAPVRRAPLDWCACAACSLVQLRHAVDLEQVCRHYHYRSGVNEVMVAELQDVVAKASALVGGVSGMDSVLDIGANDGTLLAAYPRSSVFRVAVEPARNLREACQQSADAVITDFFPLVGGPSIGDGEYKVITSIATFYATADPHAYLAEVARLLHPEGVWVVQFQDLWQMLAGTAFDNITWEHQFYPSLADMERLCAAHGLSIVDAEVRSINGGSYRLSVRHAAGRGQWVENTPAIEALREAEAGCQSWDRLEDFAWRVESMRQQITGLVDHLVRGGATIDLYAASTKSSTLLQYCGLDATCLRQAWERSPSKVGTFTAGTGIPIVSEETGRATPPDALLLGAWAFKEAFIAREIEYLRRGGKMIVPLPACEIIEGRR